MQVPIVSVRHLSHRYARDWAVRDIHFDIAKPGIVGLLGSNGAGKSTCMNAMCGVLYPTEGDVEINGNSVRDNPSEAKSCIGFLPQQPPLYPEFTVREYLTHCASLRSVPKRRVSAVVDAVMDRVGVGHYQKRLIAALSGGYRQRVGIAQAILHDPTLVVLDEPTTGLDPNQLFAMRALIREIAEDRTVLLSTHILSEVEALCDDIKMIENGRLVFEGTFDDFSNTAIPQSLIVRFGNPVQSEDLVSAGFESVDAMTQNRFRVYFADENEVSDVLIEASRDNGWSLRELYFERATLECVFAQLSDKPPSQGKLTRGSGSGDRNQ